MEEKKLKKFISFILAVITIINIGIMAFADKGPDDIVSQTYCVMSAKSGQVLISKEMDQKMEPASITKILTCAIALENLDPNDSYTFSKEATNYDTGSTHLAFTEGETCKIEDLLYGAMVESANDCAMGLADAVTKSQEEFITLMNEKVIELGCRNTHFSNVSGMPDPDHYTTARDMAIITKYAMSVEGFNKYFGAWEWTIPATNKNSERHFGTHHSMIVGSENNKVYGYDAAKYGKLGWTEEALHTMVTVAEKDGIELICVVMKSKNKHAKYQDTIKLFNYCFDNFSYTEIPVTVQKSKVKITKDGENYGEMTIYPVATVNVLHTQDIQEDEIKIITNIPKECELSRISDVAVNVSFSKESDWMETETIKVIPQSFLAKESDTKEKDAEINDREERSKFRWWIFILIPIGFLIFLLFLVLAIRFYNIKKYEKIKRHRHYNRLKRG